MMKSGIIFTSFFILFVIKAQGENSNQNFDKAAFYNAMSSGNLENINEVLSLLNTSTITEKEAYEGALLMRKSGLLEIPGEQLKYFKKGRIKLETALLKDSSNGEYHFLRLTIQEHAPKIVKYRKELETDKQFLIKSFKSFHHCLFNFIQTLIRESSYSYSKFTGNFL